MLDSDISYGESGNTDSKPQVSPYVKPVGLIINVFLAAQMVAKSEIQPLKKMKSDVNAPKKVAHVPGQRKKGKTNKSTHVRCDVQKC